MTCQRQFCNGCGRELIHRDRKKPWESSSGLGQVISRSGPRDVSTGDIDHYVRKWLPPVTLFRIVEHSWPDASEKTQQQRALKDLSAILAHAVECPESPIKLDARSGVFLLKGEIRVVGKAKRTELGPQHLSRILQDGTVELLAVLETQAEVFDWLEGRRGGARRKAA